MHEREPEEGAAALVFVCAEGKDGRLARTRLLRLPRRRGGVFLPAFQKIIDGAAEQFGKADELIRIGEGGVRFPFGDRLPRDARLFRERALREAALPAQPRYLLPCCQVCLPPSLFLNLNNYNRAARKSQTPAV